MFIYSKLLIILLFLLSNNNACLGSALLSEISQESWKRAYRVLQSSHKKINIHSIAPRKFSSSTVIPQDSHIFYLDKERTQKIKAYVPESTPEKLKQNGITFVAEEIISRLDNRDLRRPVPTSSPGRRHHTLPITPAKDQGTSYACVPFSVTACLEQQTHKILSEAPIAYFSNEECDQYGFSATADALKTARIRGTTTQEVWSFKEDAICQTPPVNWSQHIAARFSVTHAIFSNTSEVINERIFRLSTRNHTNLVSLEEDRNIALMKNLIIREIPIVVEVPLFYDSYGVLLCGWGDGKDGITMPAESALSSRSSRFNTADLQRNEAFHAVMLMGVYDAYSAFEFKNSWYIIDEHGGKVPWGNKNGCSIIPYEYIRQFGRLAAYGII